MLIIYWIWQTLSRRLRRGGAKSDNPDNLAIAEPTDPKIGLPFTIRTVHDAIDVFDRPALLELRRAARLQPVLRPASRDQIRCRAVRQRQSIEPPDEGLNPRTTPRSSDRLPSYLNSLASLRSARPAKGSSGKVSDVPGKYPQHLEASRSIFSSQYGQNRHRQNRCKLFTSSKRQGWLTVRTAKRSAKRRFDRHLDTKTLVELSGIEPLTPCLQSRCSPS